MDALLARRANQHRPMKLPEFSRLVKEYARDRRNPTAVKCQFKEVEKLEGVKKLLRLVKYQMLGRRA